MYYPNENGRLNDNMATRTRNVISLINTFRFIYDVQNKQIAELLKSKPEIEPVLKISGEAGALFDTVCTLIQYHGIKYAALGEIQIIMIAAIEAVRSFVVPNDPDDVVSQLYSDELIYVLKDLKKVVLDKNNYKTYKK